MSDNFLTYLLLAVVAYMIYKKFIAKKPNQDAAAPAAETPAPHHSAPLVHDPAEILHAAKELVVSEMMKLIKSGQDEGGGSLEIDHGECHLLFEMAGKEFNLSMEQKTQLVSSLKEMISEAVDKLGLSGKTHIEERISSVFLTFKA